MDDDLAWEGCGGVMWVSTGRKGGDEMGMGINYGEGGGGGGQICGACCELGYHHCGYLYIATQGGPPCHFSSFSSSSFRHAASNCTVQFKSCLAGCPSSFLPPALAAACFFICLSCSTSSPSDLHTIHVKSQTNIQGVDALLVACQSLYQGKLQSRE